MTNENKIKDGGPAFPTEARALFPTNKASFWCDGMSLRDWFAGMALQGVLGSHANLENHMAMIETSQKKGVMCSEFVAVVAYELADAMLKERDKKRESILDEMVKENQEMGLYDKTKI